MILSGIFAGLACLSFILLLWQWLVASRFAGLHERIADKSFAPAVSLLKPLKGCDATTAESLRSWFAQEYPGDVQILLGVATAADPVCEIVRSLIREFPRRDAALVVCDESLGTNAKVSKLIQLQRLAKHAILVLSDADVRVPPDLLVNVVIAFQSDSQHTTSENGSEEPQGLGVRQSSGAFDVLGAVPKAPEDWRTPRRWRANQPAGLANCFYRLANPTTLAMRWEAVAVNADFWSQVLQARSLRPLGFALGAVMAVKREALEKVGGFAALADYLADDYQLGKKIARAGWRIELCPVVVECWDPPGNWRAVWSHQLRWARTIRVCQPVPYFLSILSNATLWPLVWLAVSPVTATVVIVAAMLIFRILAAMNLNHRLAQTRAPGGFWWLVPMKDLLQTVIWLAAFAGNNIEWRGQRCQLSRDGKLVKIAGPRKSA